MLRNSLAERDREQDSEYTRQCVSRFISALRQGRTLHFWVCRCQASATAEHLAVARLELSTALL